MKIKNNIGKTMTLRHLGIGCTLFLICTIIGCSKTEKRTSKPNIIYILADDMGRSDIGSYGQKLIETPNLDQLAASGIKFINHYSGTTVCAPSRSALMTGLHTGHTPIRGNKEYEPEGQEPLPASAFTVFEMMKQAGYVTATFGKWGLGFVSTEGDPNNQGVDYFFGYNCQRQAHRYYPDHIWENNHKVIMEGNGWKHRNTYAQDVIQEKTLDFIDEHKEEPFFLYIPLVVPHAELVVPDDEVLQKYRKRFKDETPYIGSPGSDYGEGIEIGKYMSQQYPRATYAAMVERIDKYIGQIITKLEENGLAENTIIMFSSDNGAHQEGGNDPEFFNSNGPFRGYKRDLYEGGIRVPFIVKWAGKIKEGSETGHISAFWDLMPTLADIVGFKNLPQTDGISYLPALLGKTSQKEHDYLYWEFIEEGGRQAIRKGDWKAVRLNVYENPDAGVELYNLKDDEGETANIAHKFPKMAAEMKQLMISSHTTNTTFPLYHYEGKSEKVFRVD